MISTNGKHPASAPKQIKLPKSDIEAERAVLGCMLIDPIAAHEISMRLAPTDFYLEDHRNIFLAAVAVLKREKMVDVTTIMGELAQRKQLDILAKGDIENGGRKYLFNLTRAVASSAFAPSYSTVVREASLDRQVVAQLKVTYENKSAENLKKLNDIMNSLFTVRQPAAFDFRIDLNRAIDEMEKVRKDLVDTGFKKLDRAFGGLDPGDLTTIGARTSGGKTAFMVKVALQIAETFKRECLYLTTEMTDTQIVERVLPMTSLVPAWKFRKRSFEKEDWTKIMDACAGRLSKLPLKVVGKSTLSLADIRGAITRHKPRVLFIDYLQRCVFAHGDTRAYQVMDFMKELKTIAQDERINIFIGCQLSRVLDHDPDKEPENSDLKDSGGIEAESDQVLLLWKPTDKRVLKEGINVPDGHHLIRAKVSKNRHGAAWLHADFMMHGQLIDMCEHLTDQGEQTEIWNKRKDLH